jgi:hypothetical protein
MDDEQVFEWNGLSLAGPPFGLEKIYSYIPGGHHPVHLGDHIKDGRYRVIHKLGSGGFANVWLCRDMQSQDVAKYVALKILMGDASTDDCPELRMSKKLEGLLSDLEVEAGSKYVCWTLDQFKIDGPNRSHTCFVYPVLGPRVSSSISKTFKDPDQTLKNVCFSSAQAMNYLHSHGIVTELSFFSPQNIANLFLIVQQTSRRITFCFIPLGLMTSTDMK